MKYFAIVVLCCAVAIEAKIYSKCEFVRTIRGKVPDSELDDWTCIAKWESDYNTKAINRNNVDGSTDFGIFQINNRWWCSPGEHNACQVSCEAMMNDNLDEPLRCAKFVKAQQGFQAWVAWNNHCSNGRCRGFAGGC